MWGDLLRHFDTRAVVLKDARMPLEAILFRRRPLVDFVDHWPSLRSVTFIGPTLVAVETEGGYGLAITPWTEDGEELIAKLRVINIAKGVVLFERALALEEVYREVAQSAHNLVWQGTLEVQLRFEVQRRVPRRKGQE